MKPVRFAMLLPLLMAGISCSAATRQGAGHNPVRISAEEIDAANALNAYELIERLRPRWLRSRGSRSLTMATGIAVFLNNTHLGNVESLREISTNGITSIRYLDAAQAIAQLPGLGSEHTEGAVVISTRREP